MIIDRLEKKKVKKRNFIDCELNLRIGGNESIEPERKLSEDELKVRREHKLRCKRKLEFVLKMINDSQINCFLMSIRSQLSAIDITIPITFGLSKQIKNTRKSLAKTNSELSMLKSELESELKNYYGEKKSETD